MQTVWDGLRLVMAVSYGDLDSVGLAMAAERAGREGVALAMAASAGEGVQGVRVRCAVARATPMMTSGLFIRPGEPKELA